jgi:hypothetical protein
MVSRTLAPFLDNSVNEEFNFPEMGTINKEAIELYNLKVH